MAALVAAAVSILVLIGGFGAWRSLRQSGERRPLVLATGPESGAYHSLGSVMASLIEAGGLASRAEVRATEGSGENMLLLDSGEADLAIVQSDSEMAESVRLVATLFDEALHILIAPEMASRVSGIGDLDGRRVSLGAAASGTRLVAGRVLSHFDVEPAEDFRLGPAEALAGLRTGLDAAELVQHAIDLRQVLERHHLRNLLEGQLRMIPPKRNIREVPGPVDRARAHLRRPADGV